MHHLRKSITYNYTTFPLSWYTRSEPTKEVQSYHFPGVFCDHKLDWCFVTLGSPFRPLTNITGLDNSLHILIDRGPFPIPLDQFFCPFDSEMSSEGRLMRFQDNFCLRLKSLGTNSLPPPSSRRLSAESFQEGSRFSFTSFILF